MIPEKYIKVLLTEGHSRSSLAVARSLARRNISFLVLSDNPRCLAHYSRFVKHFMLSPSPTKEPDLFIEFVLKIIRKHGIKLVLPITDKTLFLMDKHRHLFECKTKIAMSYPQSVKNILDKRKNLQIAKSCGIPCPKQYNLLHVDQLPDMINSLGFPIVIKNPGFLFDSDINSYNLRVLYAYCKEDILRFIDRYCQSDNYPLFQEYVTGKVQNLCCFSAKGKTIAIHAYHSIRRIGGEGVLREIINPAPQLIKYASELLQALKWDGIAHIAFFVDEKQNKVWYMETNGRFWASTIGSINAGWDFPYWVYNYFLYGIPPRPNQIRIGSKTCWHFGDLRALLRQMKGGEHNSGLNNNKLLAIIQFLSAFNPRIHSDTFQLKDPLPSIMEYWKFFKKKLSSRS